MSKKTIVKNAAPDSNDIQIKTTDGTLIDVTLDEYGIVHVYVKDKAGNIWIEVIGEDE